MKWNLSSHFQVFQACVCVCARACLYVKHIALLFMLYKTIDRNKGWEKSSGFNYWFYP